MRRSLFLPFAFVLASATVHAQLSETAGWTAHLGNDYRVVPNVTYLTANNWDAKLDLYLQRGSNGPAPTVIFIHGSG